MNQQPILYWNVRSQPARAVKCLLDIGNIKFTSKVLDLGTQTRTQQYQKINPLKQVPFLVVGDFKIGQSSAILIYLCQKNPTTLKGFLGETLQQRVKVNQFLSWFHSAYRPALFKKFDIKIYGKVRKNIDFYQHQIDSADRLMDKGLKMLDFFLKGRTYLASDKPTIADLQFYFETTNLIEFDQEQYFDKYKEVKRWYKKMQEIPEIQGIYKEWKPIVDVSKVEFKKIRPIESKL